MKHNIYSINIYIHTSMYVRIYTYPHTSVCVFIRTYPYASCMEYLPTWTPRLVNIPCCPYMKHVDKMYHELEISHLYLSVLIWGCPSMGNPQMNGLSLPSRSGWWWLGVPLWLRKTPNGQYFPMHGDSINPSDNIGWYRYVLSKTTKKMCSLQCSPP